MWITGDRVGILGDRGAGERIGSVQGDDPKEILAGYEGDRSSGRWPGAGLVQQWMPVIDASNG